MVEENHTNGVPSLHVHSFTDETTWVQEGVTVAGAKRWGTSLGHLNFPSGIYVDDEETVYICDYSNNRIVKWRSGATTGEIVIGEGAQEDRTDRLRHPKDLIFDKSSNSFIIADEGNRRVARWAVTNDSGIETIIPNVDPSSLAMDDEGYLYVCDFEEHDVKRYKIGETTGTVVAGGKGKGARLNQLSHPTFISVDKDQTVFVSDWGNHRVVKWVKGAKRGVFVAGVHAYHTDPKSLADPFGLIVDQSGTIYVADWGKHRVVRWHQGAPEGTVVVGEGVMGKAPNQLNHPMCIAFDRHGNLYVSDYSNQRVQKFNINSNQITE